MEQGSVLGEDVKERQLDEDVKERQLGVVGGDVKEPQVIGVVGGGERELVQVVVD